MPDDLERFKRCTREPDDDVVGICRYCGLHEKSLHEWGRDGETCPAYTGIVALRDTIFRHTDATVISDLGAIYQAQR